MLNKILAWLFGQKPKDKRQVSQSGKAKGTSAQGRKRRQSSGKPYQSKRKGELGEYKINIQLEQMPQSYKMLHDAMFENSKSKTGYSQADHVLVTPAGVFVIETKNYAGDIAGQKKDKYWTVNGKRSLYNPIRQNYGHIKAVERIVSKTLPTSENVSIISIVTFTMRARFKIDPSLRKITSHELVIYDTELTEFVKRKVISLQRENGPTLSETDIMKVHEALKASNVTDPKLRQAHVNRASQSRTSRPASPTKTSH
ncbi:nuclease-related domain-containing protein [Caldalkalibacillus salinus]|uniref:nuclease-related domain-containing protein n=1 Tax=Caldalkalibacillus salinus TaxID=2803787 RepID=UPI0019215D1F|nr:nuclease-related domain-containing protein [Caldalkalibacillus salinus]